MPRCSGVPTRGNRNAQGDDRPGRRVDVARILSASARAIGSGLVVGCLVAPPRESRTRPAVALLASIKTGSRNPRKHRAPLFGGVSPTPASGVAPRSRGADSVTRWQLG